MFKSYCKNCGCEVEEHTTNKGTFWVCDCTDEKLTYKDVIASYTREARINQLKAMHDLMCEANDEGIYMTWIYLMPDCPSEEDFIDIAMDDDLYNECFDKFVRLIAKNGNRY